MPPKRASAFDAALLDAQKPRSSAGPAPDPVVDSDLEQLAVMSKPAIEESPARSFVGSSPVVASAALVDDSASKKGGRPRGINKVKKTLYLAGGVERIKRIQLDVAKRADLLIKDESDIVDLALILLESMMQTQTGFETALRTYEERVK